MYVAINETAAGGRGIINVLPVQLRRYVCGVNLDEASEIRLIAGKPFVIRYPDGDYYLTPRSVLSRSPAGAVTVTGAQLGELLERITRSSLYSVRDELRSGYITIEGGHRVGIAGTAVMDNGSVGFIRNISAMNIRLANEVIGAADAISGHILSGGTVRSTLIISPPGAGKTTMLRDIARMLSQRGFAVSIADERCEIAAMHGGRSAFELGGLTSVMDNCPKAEAMLMLLRSMSPDVIITDEIGTRADAEAVRSIMNSGVAVIASAHGRSIEQIMKRRELAETAELFEISAVLSKRLGAGTVEEIRKND